MPIDLQAIRAAFGQALLSENACEAIIDLLVPVLQSQTDIDPEAVGWAYWNVCDSYALLRKPAEQYGYHLEFSAWAQAALAPERRHWVVSDSSQARTLLLGGYGDFWWSVYRRANAQAPRDAGNRTVRFESHRAAADAFNAFGEYGRVEEALDHLDALLAEDPEWSAHDFACVTSLELKIQFAAAADRRDRLPSFGAALEQVLSTWRSRLATAPTTELPRLILGSWDQLNTTWASHSIDSIQVATHNGACALASAGCFPEAERLFGRYLEGGRKGMTTYAKALYLRAVWGTRHDAQEVQDLFETFEYVTLGEILRFAPDLAEVMTV